MKIDTPDEVGALPLQKLASLEIRSEGVTDERFGGATASEVGGLKSRGGLLAGVLDAVSQQVCVLDPRGIVIATNRAWRDARFAGASLTCHTVPGDHYLKKCVAEFPFDMPRTSILGAGLQQVLAGGRPMLAFECNVLSELSENWYRGEASRFLDTTLGSLIALLYTRITEEKILAAKARRLDHIRTIMKEAFSLMLRVRAPDELFEGAAKIVIDGDRFMMSWIGMIAAGNEKLSPVASAGRVEDFFDQAPAALFSLTGEPEAPMARVLKNRTSMFSNDIAADTRVLFKAHLTDHHVQSLALLPLTTHGRGVGVMTIYCSEKNGFGDEEIDALNQLAGQVSLALEIMEKKRQLEHLIYHDTVTGLPNRRFFVRSLDSFLQRARREELGAGVLLIDFVDFKIITDTLGRAGGDVILQIIGARLGTCGGECATIARLEGAEFAMLVPHVLDPTELSALAERILLDFTRRVVVGNQELYLTAHIGIAICPVDSDSAEALLAHADAALHSARTEGQLRFKFYTAAMNIHARRKGLLEAGLRRALSQDEFLLHYQPKIDTISGTIVGVEALLRWAAPTGELISPLEFIPLLEETGLIVQVGEWVLRTACQQICAWRDARMVPIQIAVNLSARQFQQEGLADMISKTLKEFSISARYIELEITESCLMLDYSAAVLILDRLRSLGIRVSIDDFGTGYSSLSHLKRLPLDSLKIDRSFISDVTVNPEDAAITRAIITMAHNLNLKVIAEGVETEEQFAFLRTNHCDEVQGYLFSKPVSAEEVTRFISVTSDSHLPMFEEAGVALPTLLLVDDDRAFRLLLEELFALDGYCVLSAARPELAFEALALHDVDVIISDENMPGMQGVEFLKRVRRMYPGIVRIMMTGQNDAETVTAAVNDGEVYKFFAKQHDEDLLHAEVARLLHQKARLAAPT